MHSVASSKGSIDAGSATARVNRANGSIRLGANLPVGRIWSGSRAVPYRHGMFPGAFAATTPDKPAYIMSSTGEAVTYAELDRRANQLSQLFRSMGLQPGDHVAFCMENHPRYLEVVPGRTELSPISQGGVTAARLESAPRELWTGALPAEERWIVLCADPAMSGQIAVDGRVFPFRRAPGAGAAAPKR